MTHKTITVPDPADTSDAWAMAVTSALRTLVDETQNAPNEKVLTRAELDDLGAVFAKELSWRNWTPQISSSTGSITSTQNEVGQYLHIGPIVFYWLNFEIVTNGTGAGEVRASLPQGPGNVKTATQVCAAYSNSNFCRGIMPVNLRRVNIRLYDGSYPGLDGAFMGAGGFYKVSNPR